MDLLTLDHAAFTLYIMHSKLEPKKLTGKWKIFSKQPIKSFMTLQCEEDYLTITGCNHFPSTFCATSLVIFFPWFTKILCVTKYIDEISIYYLCTTACNLGSLIGFSNLKFNPSVFNLCFVCVTCNDMNIMVVDLMPLKPL